MMLLLSLVVTFVLWKLLSRSFCFRTFIYSRIFLVFDCFDMSLPNSSRVTKNLTQLTQLVVNLLTFEILVTIITIIKFGSCVHLTIQRISVSIHGAGCQYSSIIYTLTNSNNKVFIISVYYLLLF